MLKSETVRREMRRLQKIRGDLQNSVNVRCKALAMINTLRWVLGGCTWQPSSIVGVDE